MINLFHQKFEVFADMMLNTSVICSLKWLSDKFLTISLNIQCTSKSLWSSANSFKKSSALPRRAGWAICSKCQEILGHLLTKPGPSTKNTDKFLVTFAKKFQTIYQEYSDKFLAICREILDHMPRNPGPSAENANKFSAICQDCQGPPAKNANKSSAICRYC